MRKAQTARKLAVLVESLEGGGAQRRAVELVNGFVALGREVDLLVVRPDGALRNALAASVRLIPLDRRSPEESLANYLNDESADVLLAASASVHALAVEASRRSGHRVPLVLRASSDPRRYIPWTLIRQRLLEIVRRRLRLRRYAAADLVISVSEDIARTVRTAIPGLDVVTISNPVVTEAFLGAADDKIAWPWTNRRRVPTIISVGRLAMAKDFPTLLRAFAIVRRRRELRLVIVGSGSSHELRNLTRLSERLGIGDDVAFAGESDSVAAWLRRCDLFVSSSLWEGSSGALVEALAMGCPVVATNSVGSARELIADERLGRLAPPRAPLALAAAIEAELSTTRDPAQLKSAAEPYASADQPAKYLFHIDRCVSQFAAHMDKP